MHKQNHLNSQLKTNGKTINRQPSQQSSLFNKNNSKNNPIKINLTKANPIAYKTSTTLNKEKESEKLKFSNKNSNSNFSELNKTPVKGTNTNVYTVSNTNSNYYLTYSDKNYSKNNLNYANSANSNKILNSAEDKIGTPKTERSLNPSFSNNSYKSINSQEPSTIRKDPFSFKNLEKFLNTKYDGRVRLDLLPKKYLTAHMIAANSKIIFKDYGHIKGKYEDCEHRAFHMKAINNDNAKIMITKDILFY